MTSFNLKSLPSNNFRFNTQFDKNYIPKGSFHSLYVEDTRISPKKAKEIFAYIDENSNIQESKLASKFDITKEQAKNYIERRKNK